MNTIQFVKSFLSQNAFYALNKTLVKEIGLIETTLLSLLIDRHSILENSNSLSEDWFFCNSEYLQTSVNVGRRPLDTALSHLEEIGFIKTERKGLPAKKYFYICFDTIYSFLHDNTKSNDISSLSEMHNQVSAHKQVCAKCTNLCDQNAQTIYNKKEYNKKEYYRENKELFSEDNNSNSLKEKVLERKLTKKENEKEKDCTTAETQDSDTTPPTTKVITPQQQTFEEFRKLYRGSKRGLQTEFENFCRKHKDWREVLAHIKDDYLHQCDLKDQARRQGCFIPQEKNLQTYINQRCWEEEPAFQKQFKRNADKTLAERMQELQEVHQQNEQIRKLLWNKH